MSGFRASPVEQCLAPGRRFAAAWGKTLNEVECRSRNPVLKHGAII